MTRGVGGGADGRVAGRLSIVLIRRHFSALSAEIAAQKFPLRLTHKAASALHMPPFARLPPNAAVESRRRVAESAPRFPPLSGSLSFIAALRSKE